MPSYALRTGFRPSDWTEVSSSYTWAQLASAFTWPDLVSGPVPPEDVRAMALDRTVGTLFGPVQVGEAEVVLDNVQRQYVPRPYDRVSVKGITDAGSVYPLFFGHIEDVSNNAELGNQRVHLRAQDHLRDFEKKIHLPLLTDVSVSSLVTQIFRQVFDEESDFVVDRMSDVIPFNLIDDESAGSALQRIVESGAHFLHADGLGRARFRDRNTDFLAADVTSLNQYFGFSWLMSRDQIINDMVVAGVPRRRRPTFGTVAQLDEQIRIAPNSRESFTVEFIDPDTNERRTPVQDVFFPVPYTDFTAAFGGSGGVDATTTVALTASIHAMSTDVVVTNPSSLSVTLTSFQLRGFPVQRISGVAARLRVSSSEARYGQRTFVLQNDLIPTFNHARAYTEYLSSKFSEPLENVSFSLKNEYPLVFGLGLLDTVALVESHTNVGSLYLVTSVAHEIVFDERGTEHRVDYGTRLQAPLELLTLDEDTLDGPAVLGF